MSRPIVRPNQRQLELARSGCGVMKPRGGGEQAKRLGHIHPFGPHLAFELWLDQFVAGLTRAFRISELLPIRAGGWWQSSKAGLLIQTIARMFSVCPVCVVALLGDPGFRTAPAWYWERYESSSLLLDGIGTSRDEQLFMAHVIWAALRCRGQSTQAAAESTMREAFSVLVSEQQAS